jgi:hypothetical protein
MSATHPGLIDCGLFKLAIQHIVEHRQVVSAVGGMDKLAPPHGFKLMGAHEASYVITADADALMIEHIAQPPTAIAAPRSFERTAARWTVVAQTA